MVNNNSCYGTLNNNMGEVQQYPETMSVSSQSSLDGDLHYAIRTEPSLQIDDAIQSYKLRTQQLEEGVMGSQPKKSRKKMQEEIN